MPTAEQESAAARRRQVEAGEKGVSAGGKAGEPVNFDAMLGQGGPFISIGSKRCLIAPPVNNKRRFWFDAMNRCHVFVYHAVMTPPAPDGSVIDFEAIARNVNGPQEAASDTGEEARATTAEDVKQVFRQLAILEMSLTGSDGQEQEAAQRMVTAMHEAVLISLQRHTTDLTLEDVAAEVDTVTAVRMLRCVMDQQIGVKASF